MSLLNWIRKGKGKDVGKRKRSSEDPDDPDPVDFDPGLPGPSSGITARVSDDASDPTIGHIPEHVHNISSEGFETVEDESNPIGPNILSDHSNDDVDDDDQLKEPSMTKDKSNTEVEITSAGTSCKRTSKKRIYKYSETWSSHPELKCFQNIKVREKT
ncbi:uncharacterized protein [Macrobrachium rosenbergii]|uniref:uncharacterized protein n=1 Tax=Macrobrachium rosenbergii TaxID=79674 RepID=UPI0034D60A98